jgi:membrane fusion protein (multidrug efflux system)
MAEATTIPSDDGERSVARPGLGARTRRRLLIAAGVLAVSACVAAGVHRYVVASRFESTNDAFVEGHVTSVGTRVAGHVLAVAVEDNARVKAGDVLVRLDPADFEARAAQARADLDAARNRMLSARAAVAAAEAEGRAASAELERARREAERLSTLFERGAASRQALDAAVSLRDAGEARVHALASRADAERAMLGNDAPVRQAQAALDATLLALSYTTLVAPVDGVIGRRNVEAGGYVTPGQPLLSIAADRGTWVVANFKETQIGRMRPGDPVDVRLDAYPGVVWKGRLQSMAPATGATFALLPPDNATGNFTKVVQRVPVKIVLEDVVRENGGETPLPAPDALPVGLSAEVQVGVR